MLLEKLLSSISLEVRMVIFLTFCRYVSVSRWRFAIEDVLKCLSTIPRWPESFEKISSWRFNMLEYGVAGSMFIARFELTTFMVRMSYWMYASVEKQRINPR